jgi:hypothetical protein
MTLMQPSTFTPSLRPTTLRSFWHGSSLGPYQLVGLRSFVDYGHRVELYTYDSEIAVPNWIVRKDANEIWRTDHVLRYQHDIGRGSFALHANLFRNALLFKIGGWWVDHDVVLLRPELPQEDIFFSMETLDPMRATFSVLKFPARHPAMGEALERCVALGETAVFGETGADLFTEMVAKYDLAKFGRPMEMTYPISALEVPKLFDPSQCDQLQSQCAESNFLHLFNETWRRAGIPSYLGPPKGSFIEYLLQKYGFDAFLPRMELADLKRWTSYLTLYEEFQAGQKAYRLSNEALRARLNTLEQENARLSNEALRLNALQQENADLKSCSLRIHSICRKMRLVLGKINSST